jgi:hypothetical protein
MDFGYVYFVQAGKNHIKIGSAFNPIERIRTLQTGCPDFLNLLGVIPSYVFRRRETDLHELFSKWRVDGEWFEPSYDILDYIKKNTFPWDDVVGVDPEDFQWHIGMHFGQVYKEKQILKNAQEKLLTNYNIPVLELCRTLGISREAEASA